jgi:hypothetical protein
MPPSLSLRHGFHARAALLLAAGLLLGSCGSGTTPDTGPATIDPATFIATYVDLRLAVLQPEPGKMNDSIRSAILARHGVTERQLEDFVKVHGSDVVYMRSIWEKVQKRMQDTRPNGTDGPSGSTAGGPSGPPGGSPGRASAVQAGGQLKPDGQRVPSTH